MISCLLYVTTLSLFSYHSQQRVLSISPSSSHTTYDCLPLPLFIHLHILRLGVRAPGPHITRTQLHFYRLFIPFRPFFLVDEAGRGMSDLDPTTFLRRVMTLKRLSRAPTHRFCVYVFHRDNIRFPIAHEAIQRILVRGYFIVRFSSKMSLLRRGKRKRTDGYKR